MFRIQVRRIWKMTLVMLTSMNSQKEKILSKLFTQKCDSICFRVLITCMQSFKAKKTRQINLTHEHLKRTIAIIEIAKWMAVWFGKKFHTKKQRVESTQNHTWIKMNWIHNLPKKFSIFFSPSLSLLMTSRYGFLYMYRMFNCKTPISMCSFFHQIKVFIDRIDILKWTDSQAHLCT